MEKLLEAVTTLVSLVSPDKIHSISARVRKLDPVTAKTVLLREVSSQLACSAVERLSNEWLIFKTSPDELAGMLIAAAHTLVKVKAQEQIELVWTGPTTQTVAARRTEQALLQVISSAANTLFITSFVAYDVSSIVAALNAACARGVEVFMLLESSHDHGGSINMDVIGKMKVLVPGAHLLAWKEKKGGFIGGRVHAKVAVADLTVCFITSANLTGHAMERNMEAGVLINGGDIPNTLGRHLEALVEMKVLCSV